MVLIGDIYCMIIPTDISPIDYLKDSNEFVFVTAGFILKVNYEKEVFELQTPDKLAFHEHFELLKSPPEWFDTIDFGLVDWVRIATNWSNEKSRPRDASEPYSFEVEDVIYKGRFNPRTNNLSLTIPGKTIICKRGSITTDYPEVQFMDYGQLITSITSVIIGKMKEEGIIDKASYPPSLPLVFKPESIVIGENTYEFGYCTDLDLALLIIPEREIQANLLTIETDALELTELHQGMLFDMIRSVVYEKSPSE